MFVFRVFNSLVYKTCKLSQIMYAYKLIELS